MTRILLINPNTSQATTDMMVAIAQDAAPNGVTVVGATAAQGPAMIVDPAALAASAGEVVAIGLRLGRSVAGVIVAAFGDPGLGLLRDQLPIPVVGIAESSMREAARNGRRFGVATVTPALVPPIDATAAALGLDALYTGTRVTEGDPLALTADPARLLDALHTAARHCVDTDGAEAVIIGGGPLGHAATALATQLPVPIVAPIPAAVGRLVGRLGTAPQVVITPAIDC